METVRAVRWGTCANPGPRRVRVSSSQRIGPRNGFIPKGILRECGDCPMEFVFTGYHATSRDRAEAIMRRNFKKSKSGWLGEGVYFFEDNPKLAVEWARYKYRNDENALSAVTVIQSEIRCHKEKILDLTNPQSEDVSDFHRVRQNIIIHLRKFGKKDIDIEETSWACFDGMAIDLLRTKRNFSLVRHYTFTPTLLDRASLTYSRVPNGIELCVKDLSCIVSKSLMEKVVER